MPLGTLQARQTLPRAALEEVADLLQLETPRAVELLRLHSEGVSLRGCPKPNTHDPKKYYKGETKKFRRSSSRKYASVDESAAES